MYYFKTHKDSSVFKEKKRKKKTRTHAYFDTLKEINKTLLLKF